MFVNLVRASGRLVEFLRQAPALLESLRKAVKAAGEASRDSAALSRKTMELVAASEHRVAALQKDVQALHEESRQLRGELRERLLQYNLQLGRLARTRRRDAAHPTLAARSVPATLDSVEPFEWTAVRREPEASGHEWLMLDACPACGHRERTVVNSFNKLVLLDAGPDATAARYDYALCHACGLGYATRRPFGSRYRHLLDHFGDVTGKLGDREAIGNPVLNPLPLAERDRDQLSRMASRGVWVSDHLGLSKDEYLEGLVKDRFANSMHLDLLASLVAPTNARVLDIRPRTGTISEGLRRLFNARVCAMPIWESQRFLLREVYGIESSGLVDYDEFAIPFEDRFDLIICNHMFTHVVRPERFFDAILRHLNPDGYVYLYNEPDDAEFVRGAQSMLAALNPLHLQTFDQRSLVRALAARGLEVVFVKGRDLNHLCLARPARGTWRPMSDRERDSRIAAYRRAYDRAVLMVPPDVRPRFAVEWSGVVERGVAHGLAEFDRDGNLRLVARAARH